MSLILAIEPDRRQVAQLIAIVRHVKGAELVLADTTERALESIGNSVPDLILVPALLSPQDDAALAAALRVIATAAHVQMLTIPTFATAKARPKSRGVLSAFRRKSIEDEGPAEGCDPKVFAEQITSYLERASEERAAAQLLEDDSDQMAADSFSAPAQTFDAVRADFDRAVAPIFNETPAEETIAAELAEAQRVDDVEAEILSAAPIIEEAPFAVEETELPLVEDVHVEPPPEMSIAAAPPEPPMALEEFVATLERVEPAAVVEDAPLAAAAAVESGRLESIELDIDLTTELEEVTPDAVMVDSAADSLPTLDALLADFERADLPHIEEVRAEQWMDASETDQDPDEAPKEIDEETTQADIDLSIELEAVLHTDKSAEQAERFEPFAMAAWQSWPRLDGTVSSASLENRADPSAGSDNQIAEFQIAEFEAALQEPEPLERYEPVVHAESVEPLPLTAWHAWPRLEGVVAEAYQEPIAPRKVAARPEWVELMRSLREDIARRRAELNSPAQAAQVAHPAPAARKPLAPQAQVPQAAKPAAPAAAATAAAAEEALKKRPKRTRPIEDEWGLFDPEQCGFAALLDKLDEITVPPANSHPRR
jgi:hypothetical protein